MTDRTIPPEVIKETEDAIIAKLEKVKGWKSYFDFRDEVFVDLLRLRDFSEEAYQAMEQRIKDHQETHAPMQVL